MKNLSPRFTFIAAALCVLQFFSCSSDTDDSSGGKGKGNDIENYKTKKIGNQVWMVENLDYAVEGSRCYNDAPANCSKYGRLYSWETAMEWPPDSCKYKPCSIGPKHKGICPSGWHIPSNADWDELMKAVGGESTAGKKLKATSGWNKGGNGTDEYGFSALPGGIGDLDSSFSSVGYYGFWWSTGENTNHYAYFQYMGYNYENASRNYRSKSNLFSVRCLQN